MGWLDGDWWENLPLKHLETMVLHGFAWFYMVLHGFSRFYMVFRGFRPSGIKRKLQPEIAPSLRDTRGLLTMFGSQWFLQVIPSPMQYCTPHHRKWIDHVPVDVTIFGVLNEEHKNKLPFGTNPYSCLMVKTNPILVWNYQTSDFGVCSFELLYQKEWIVDINLPR